MGHSYGGAIITEAGTNPKVAGLVYITAFATDEGESVNSLAAKGPWVHVDGHSRPGHRHWRKHALFTLFNSVVLRPMPVPSPDPALE